jgi:hypothetical protein
MRLARRPAISVSRADPDFCCSIKKFSAQIAELLGAVVVMLDVSYDRYPVFQGFAILPLPTQKSWHF